MKDNARSVSRFNLQNLKGLIALSAISALGDRKRLRSLFAKQSFQKIPKQKVEEALLEIHLFAGFPATIDAFIELRRYDSLKLGSKPIGKGERRRDRLARGRTVCRQVYGNNYLKLMKRMKGLHPTLAQWILEDGYGKVLSRPGLTLIEREVVAIAALAVVGWDRQLESHVLGVLNLGVKPGIFVKLFEPLRTYLSRKQMHRLVTMSNPKEMA